MHLKRLREKKVIEKMKGDRELEKLLSEIPSPQSTSPSSHGNHNQHYHRQMTGSAPPPDHCYNLVSASDDGSSSLSSSSNHQAPSSQLVDQLMMMGSTDPPPHHCYWTNTNNGCVVLDERLMGQFQNMNMKLNNSSPTSTNNNNNVARNIPPPLHGFYQGLSASADASAAGFRSPRTSISSTSSIRGVPFGEKARCILRQRGAAAAAGVNVVGESYVASPPHLPPPQNQSNSSLYSSNTSYYSCPISYPFDFEERPRLLPNDCYNNSLQTPSLVYHSSPSCAVAVADPPLQQHCKMDFKASPNEVFSSSRLCLPMYKPYSSNNEQQPVLHPRGTNMGVMNLMNSSDLFHPKHALTVDNPLYNSPSFLKARMMRGDHNIMGPAENRRLFPQSLVLMKTAKKLDTTYGGLEDTYLIQERCLNGTTSGKYDPSRVRVRNCRSGSTTVPFLGVGDESLEFNTLLDPERICENGRSLVDCHPSVLQPTFNSLSDVQGNIYLIAKDQHGCRFLQKKFEEGSYEDVEIIFNEIIDRIVELMMNPFGNYLIQKLLEVCHEEQRMRIVHMVTREPGELVRISLNTHGTRVVQKLIETLSTQEEVSLVVHALEPGFLDLIKDLNGNHVIQRCLQCLSSEDNMFIFDAAAKFCVDIATHRHGCCVLQRCIDHSNGEQRQKLIAEICANGLLLAQDPFGNYVVQYILEKKIPSASAQLVSQFDGHYVHLSMQKFSSHVVEKCLKFYEDNHRPRIVHELLSVSHFEQVLQDQYANYVIQSALDVTKGPVHDSLVAAVRPHTILRTNPYCKKIFSRGLLKK